jgi:hypothetical protein
MASSSTRFLDHTQRRATVGMTPLDEWLCADIWMYSVVLLGLFSHRVYWSMNGAKIPKCLSANGTHPRQKLVEGDVEII